MAMIDEGEDLIETGEEVVAKVKQFLQSGCACSKGPKVGRVRVSSRRILCSRI